MKNLVFIFLFICFLSFAQTEEPPYPPDGDNFPYPIFDPPDIPIELPPFGPRDDWPLFLKVAEPIEGEAGFKCIKTKKFDFICMFIQVAEYIRVASEYNTDLLNECLSPENSLDPDDCRISGAYGLKKDIDECERIFTVSEPA